MAWEQHTRSSWNDSSMCASELPSVGGVILHGALIETVLIARLECVLILMKCILIP
jgi:hypothetical protein